MGMLDAEQGIEEVEKAPKAGLDISVLREKQNILILILSV